MLGILTTHGELIENFGKEGLYEEALLAGEQFLVRIVAIKKFQNFSSFDDLRVNLYKQSMCKKFVDLPCTSASLRENIKRAYFQVTRVNRITNFIFISRVQNNSNRDYFNCYAHRVTYLLLLL